MGTSINSAGQSARNAVANKKKERAAFNRKYYGANSAGNQQLAAAGKDKITVGDDGSIQRKEKPKSVSAKTPKKETPKKEIPRQDPSKISPALSKIVGKQTSPNQYLKGVKKKAAAEVTAKKNDPSKKPERPTLRNLPSPIDPKKPRERRISKYQTPGVPNAQSKKTVAAKSKVKDKLGIHPRYANLSKELGMGESGIEAGLQVGKFIKDTPKRHARTAVELGKKTLNAHKKAGKKIVNAGVKAGYAPIKAGRKVASVANKKKKAISSAIQADQSKPKSGLTYKKSDQVKRPQL